MDRTEMLIAKARMGDITPEEERELQQALLGLAPSSQEFKAISSVLGNHRKATGFMMGNPMENGRGMPTLDFMSPIGSAMEAGNPLGWAADRVFGENTQGNTLNLDALSGLGGAIEDRNPLSWAADRVFGEGPEGPLPMQAPGFVNPLFGLAGKLGGDSPAKSSPAEVSNTQGEAPVGSNTEVSSGGRFLSGSTRNSDPEVGGKFGLAAGNTDSGLSTTLGGNPEDVYSDLAPPQGYTFSDMNASGIERNLSDPAAYARTFAREAGGGEAFTNTYVDPVKSAMALAAMGVIGPGGMQYGSDLRGDVLQPDSARLQAVEEFMRDYASREKEVDPRAVFNQVFQRASNTDMSQIESPQTHTPMTHEEIINYTNASLMAAAPFMTEEGAAWLSSILENMGNQYLDEVGSAGPGQKTMSYPQYLAAHDIDKLLGQ